MGDRRNRLVMASALLAVAYFRRGLDRVAAGSLVFSIGQGIIVSSAAMDLVESVPWCASFGFVTSALFAVTALRIFAGAAT